MVKVMVRIVGDCWRRKRRPGVIKYLYIESGLAQFLSTGISSNFVQLKVPNLGPLTPPELP
jgi:hypothetical protein